MFRTGDMGRWTDDMSLEYLGRKDGQVRIRGFRVNLEEVEQKIRQCSSDITHVAAIVSDLPAYKNDVNLPFIINPISAVGIIHKAHTVIV